MNAGLSSMGQALGTARQRAGELRARTPEAVAKARGAAERVRQTELPSRNQTLAALLAALLLFGTYQLWFRNSSLVAVQDVTINGDQGDEQLRRDLRQVSTSMTTLNFDHSRLDAITSKYTSIERIEADPSFPSGVTIDVVFHTPLAWVDLRGRTVGVAGDGTLLRGMEVDIAKVPMLDSKVEKGSAKGEGLELMSTLAGAPGPLLKQAEGARWDEIAGPVVELQGGLELRFGAATRISDKWKAAAAVLADPGLKSASYLDLTVPERPAAGGAA